MITAAVLFYVALTDFKQFKIRNELILVLAGLFVVHAILSGRWVSAHRNLASPHSCSAPSGSHMRADLAPSKIPPFNSSEACVEAIKKTMASHVRPGCV